MRITSFTPEQEAAVRCRAPRVRVEAGAGTGKTSMLVGYARHRSGKRGLYLAFNKAVQLHAKRLFPTHCATSTLHALAYPSTGRQYQVAGKLARSIPHAAAMSLVPDRDLVRRLLRVRLALTAVHDYVVSDARDLSLSASVVVEALRIGVPLATVTSDAERLWAVMRDPRDTRLPALHDHYLKIWALTRAEQDIPRYAFVLADEAQDLNPVADSVLRAHARTLVYVGDSAQGIYAFRGATDCLASMPAAAALSLTQSFRFGDAIAGVANRLLGQFKSTPLRLSGVRGPDYVGPVQEDLPYAVLCRTNAGVFSVAAKLARRGRRVHFIGGLSGYADRIQEAYQLSKGRLGVVRDAVFRALGSIEAVRDYAELVDDAELRSVCRVVEAHGDEIPSILERAHACSVQTVTPGAESIETAYPADVYVGTCHRAKGLEFAQVVVGDDFPSFYDGDRLLSADLVDQQEVNLLYVALTRASVVLQVPPWLNWLSASPVQEQFTPVPSAARLS